MPKNKYYPRRLDRVHRIYKGRLDHRIAHKVDPDVKSASINRDRRELTKEAEEEYGKLTDVHVGYVEGTSKKIYANRGPLERQEVKDLIDLVRNSTRPRGHRIHALEELRKFESEVNLPLKDRLKTPEDLQ